jgi:hypothetical protein
MVHTTQRQAADGVDAELLDAGVRIELLANLGVAVTSRWLRHPNPYTTRHLYLSRSRIELAKQGTVTP